MTRLRLTAICVLGAPWLELSVPTPFVSSFAFPLPMTGHHIHHGSADRCGGRLHATTKASWGVADDWSSLSSENPHNAVPETSDIFNEDLASQAAQRMELEGKQLSEEDQWISDAVETVHNHGFLGESSPSDPPLYDTDFESYAHSVSFLDEMGQQISMLVNCNERPEDMLIEGGRALAPLSDEEKNDVTQLVSQSQDGKYEPTTFFQEAVKQMFMDHAGSETNHDGETEYFLDAQGCARWMTKSIGSNESGKVSAHDRRVLTTIAQFAPYGSGRLGLEDFQRLYLSAVTECLNGKSVTAGRQSKMKLPSIDTVWSDIRNHGILSPVELERTLATQEIRAEFGSGSRAETIQNGRHLEALMDECEIVEWAEDSKALSFTSEDKNDPGARRKKGSYELVKLAPDGKTPVQMRDGDFVFIDEESCIGCAQCASVCPSSFVMLDTGRARTFSQRRAPDVSMAISACPVDCMHRVSFDELKEMEVARDQGDGRSDHRHLGHRRGHTPLSVAGIDSDANHRSSWYHYLKQKCQTSSSCPQRGCYDCPNYAPGENPYFKKRERKAERVRANYVMESGIADEYRKTVEL